MTYGSGRKKHGKGAKGMGKGSGKSLPNRQQNASWGSWQPKPSLMERKFQSHHDKMLHQLALVAEKTPTPAPRPKAKAKARSRGKPPQSGQLTMEWRPFGALAGVVPVEQFHHRVEEIRGYQVEEATYAGINNLIIYFAPGNACGCVRTTPSGAFPFSGYNRETGYINWNAVDTHSEGAPSGPITSTEVEPYPDMLLSNQVRILRSAFRIKVVFPPQAMLTFNWVHMSDADAKGAVCLTKPQPLWQWFWGLYIDDLLSLQTGLTFRTLGPVLACRLSAWYSFLGFQAGREEHR